MVDQKTIDAVWDKGEVIPKFSSAIWRHDFKGNVIKKGEHGNRKSKYGWEIDHIKTKANGGGDGLSNLRPLQWEANLARNKK